MVKKIKRALSAIDNIDYNISYDEETRFGVVTLRSSRVNYTIIRLLTRVVNIISITCIARNAYHISFSAK